VETVELLIQEPEAEEYEARVAEVPSSNGVWGLWYLETSDPDERLTEEEQEQLSAAIEKFQDRPLSDILASARALLEP
jgi:hypothetical protein